MSRDLLVFLNEIPEIAALQKTVDDLKLPMKFGNNRELDNPPGQVVEMTWNKVPARVELSIKSLQDVEVFGIGSSDVGDRKTVINWHLGDKWRDECCAYTTVAALVHGYSAMVFATEPGRFISLADLTLEINHLKQRDDARNIPLFDPTEPHEW